MSFVKIEPNSDFTLNNIPFGIISTNLCPIPRTASAIGDYAIDLKVLADCGAFNGPILSNHAVRVFSQVYSN